MTMKQRFVSVRHLILMRMGRRPTMTEREKPCSVGSFILIRMGTRRPVCTEYRRHADVPTGFGRFCQDILLHKRRYSSILERAARVRRRTTRIRRETDHAIFARDGR